MDKMRSREKMKSAVSSRHVHVCSISSSSKLQFCGTLCCSLVSIGGDSKESATIPEGLSWGFVDSDNLGESER